MSKQTVTATVDVSEPPQMTEVVASHDEVAEWALDALDAADLVIADIGFERKTVEDLAASIEDGRLDAQVRKLSDAFETAYILLDGDLIETEQLYGSSMRPSSLRGAIASVTARDNGIEAVIPCSSTELLVDEAVRLARKHTEDPSRSFVPDPDPAVADAPTPVKMYAALPGVGPELAERLADEFPVPAALVEAGADDLQQVEGIGERRAAEIVSEVRLDGSVG